MNYRSLALGLSPVLLTACQSSPTEEQAPTIAVESETGGAQTHVIGAERIRDGQMSEELARLQAEFEAGGALPLRRIEGTLIGADAKPLIGKYAFMFTADVETAPNVSQSSSGSFEVQTDENGRFVHEIEHGFGLDLSKPARFVFAVTPPDSQLRFMPGGLYPDPSVMLAAHYLHQPANDVPNDGAGAVLDLERVQLRALEAALTVDSRQIEGVFTLHFIPGKDLGIELPWAMSNTMVGLGGGGEDVLYTTPGAEGWQLRASTENQGIIDLPHAAPGDTVVVAP
jgi:hypothetical protein